MANLFNFFPILWKTCAKLRANPRGNRVEIFVENPKSTFPGVDFHTFSHFFPPQPTAFPTTHTPLFLLKVFHYSTTPTTTITNIY